MKPAKEWDLDHLLQLPTGEFDWFEIKGRKALDFSLSSVDQNKVLDGLSQQLSAFANSGGGTLVFGITESKELGTRTIDDGGISIALRGRNVREWLEDIIPNLVEFPLKKFNVYALTRTSGAPQLSADRCIIIVDINDSENAPHQARDQKYYARVAGKSRPIGHRFVTDIFHRQRHATFEVEFLFRSETWIPKDIIPLPRSRNPPRRRVQLIISATNTGRVYAKYVQFRLWLPADLCPEEGAEGRASEELDGEQYIPFNQDNTRRDVLSVDGPYSIKRYGPSWFDPVLPQTSRTWKFDCVSTLRSDQLDDRKIFWMIQGDNGGPALDSTVLRDIIFDARDKHKVE